MASYLSPAMRFTSRDLYIEMCVIANSAENVVLGIIG